MDWDISGGLRRPGEEAGRMEERVGEVVEVVEVMGVGVVVVAVSVREV